MTLIAKLKKEKNRSNGRTLTKIATSTNTHKQATGTVVTSNPSSPSTAAKLPANTSSTSKTQSSSGATTGASASTKIITPTPIVTSPNWEIRYDPTLNEYYYINTTTNEIQFDHPDEVHSPTSSPVLASQSCFDSNENYDTDHRKFFSTSLKRTLSPRFFSKNNSSASSGAVPRKPQRPVSFDQNMNDEDVEEFKKHLQRELQSYEDERLKVKSKILKVVPPPPRANE